MSKAGVFFLICMCLLLLPQTVFGSVIHVVQKGDSLSNIASTYHTDVDRLTEMNGLPNEEDIIPGLSLLVPGSQYNVQPSENLWQIAKRHSVPLDRLKSINNLDTDRIYPNQTLKIPDSPSHDIFTGAFFVPSGTETDQSSLERYRQMISSVAFFEYHPDAAGNLSSMRGEASIGTAWKKNLVPFATITNLSDKGFDPELAHQVIGQEDTRNKLIENIYNKLHANDLKGVIIDFEGIHNKDRQNFNTFIKELSARLQPVGMKVSVTVPPMQGTKYPAYYSGYDYETIGNHADSVFLMTYDWHWTGGPAGPIAPISQVRNTVEYAISTMPRSKIILGVPMYAYDWVTDNEKEGEAYAQEHAVDLAVKHQSVIQYNAETSQPWFRYKDDNGNQHEVWFEDARSILSKYRLVKEYNIAGMGGWKMGLSFPQAEELLIEEFDL